MTLVPTVSPKCSTLFYVASCSSSLRTATTARYNSGCDCPVWAVIQLVGGRDRNGRYAVVRHPGVGPWFMHLFFKRT